MTGLPLLLVRAGFSLAFGAVGVRLLGAARAVVVRRRALRERGRVVEGRVVAHETRRLRSQAGSPTYRAPVVAFVTDAGVPVRFSPSRLLDAATHPVGHALRVRYLPDDPAAADVEPPGSAWAPLVLLLALALVALAIASLPWLLAPRGAR